MTRYILPELSYEYSALEPHISAEIMQLHHDKHHRAYVEGANAAVDKLAEARRSGDLTHVAALERELAFNVSGHVVHSMFWQNLQYKTDKAKYFEALWNLWNWRDVEARYGMVRQLDLGLSNTANGAAAQATT